MTWKVVKHEVLLEAIAIGVMVAAILFLLAPSSRSVESENESKIVKVEGKKKPRQSPRIQKVQKSSFTESEITEFSSIESDITNKVAKILIDNDLDTLERFLEFLREKDDWRKVKSVADALFSVEDWKSRVTEEAQDYVLDAVSEYTPNTLPELLGFLESPYEDIQDDALAELADSIEESEDEKGMCSLISMLSGTVNNAEFAERMIEHMDMMDLTHDVSNAMMHILSKGTPAFKKALSDFLIDEEYADKNEKTALAYGVGKWLSERLAEEADD